MTTTKQADVIYRYIVRHLHVALYTTLSWKCTIVKFILFNVNAKPTNHKQEVDKHH